MSDGPDGGFDGHDGHDSLSDGIEHHAFDGEHDHADGHGLGHEHFHGFDHGFQADVVAAIMGGFALGAAHSPEHHGLHAGGVCEDDVSGKGRKVYMPGIAIAPRMVQALAWPHGNVSNRDNRCFINPRLKLRTLLQKAGFVDVGTAMRDVAPSDEVQMKLLDTTPFDERVGNTPMPCGWYPNATGHTRTWKDFYLIGRRWGLIGPRVAAPEDLEEGVYLAIAGATWYFDQTFDYETRVAVSIKCRTKYDPDVPAWRGNLKLVDQHRDTAERVLREWLAHFQCFPVTQASAEARERVLSIPPREDRTRHVPPPSSVSREMFKGLRPGSDAGIDGINAESFPG